MEWQRYKQVYDKSTDEAIGFAGVKKVSDSDYAESGLCIARKCQEKGYGKELLLLLLSIAFDELHGDKFIYAAMEGNTVSINLCRSCGFVYASSKKVIRKWDNYEYVSEIFVLTAQQYFSGHLSWQNRFTAINSRKGLSE